MAVRVPSLRAVAAFEAAARHQSFSKAAEELNLSQSAISHAIRSLEVRLGQTLFERSSSSVELTESGQVFASRIRLSMSLLADAFDVTPRIAKSRLTISALPAFAELVLGARLQNFLDLHPDLIIELRSTPRLADLGQEGVDLAIRYGPGGWANLTSRQIATEDLFAVSAPSYRGGALPVSPKDLASCDVIHHSHFPWSVWLEAAGCEDLALEKRLVIDDSALNLAWAEAGYGVALARGLLVQPYLKSGRLVRLFDVAVPSRYTYHCVWNPTSPRRALIERFVDSLADAVARAEAG